MCGLNRFKLTLINRGNIFETYLLVDSKKRKYLLKKISKIYYIPENSVKLDKIREQLKKEKEILKLLEVEEIPKIIKEKRQDSMIISYFEGITLKEYITRKVEKKEKLLPKEIAGIIEKLLNVVEKLHKFQVIHGDITPSNILINRGELYLIDFSNVHLSGEKSIYIQKTNNYSPPEMNNINRVKVFSSDIYSICVIIIELFKQGNLLEEKNRIENSFLEKGLRKNMNERFQTIEELKKYLVESS